jgi:acyl-CoA synthetase (AMP-forming)/AMP-acid ligase II
MVQAGDVVPNPLLFLDLINKYDVAVSFTPNFFLASLCRALDHDDALALKSGLDLSNLQTIITGGEANVVETCVALTKLLQKYGAPANVLSPAFGMTETCGGSIYSKDCPRRDIECNNEFATVGSCLEGLDIRMTDDSGQELARNVTGNLEVRGPVVFSTYYNNPEATISSFNGEWFITGDCGVIDSQGQVLLTGRSKETAIVNGVNYYPHEIESVLEYVLGTKPSYTLVFPYRSLGAQTESFCVVYYPTYANTDVEMLAKAHDMISKLVIQQTSVRPCIIPLDGSILQKSTLGKLPRAKVRLAFEKGEYREYQNPHEETLANYRARIYKGPTAATERLILDIFHKVFDVAEYELGINTNIFSLGVDSIGLIKLKQRLQMDMMVDIPIITIMTHSSI